MRKTWIVAALLLVAVTLGVGSMLVAHAQGTSTSDTGHFVPLSGQQTGVLDAWTGTIYYIDPADQKKVVVMDMKTATYGVRDLNEGKAAAIWNPPVGLQSGASIGQKKEVNFIQIENKLEIMDTRTGEIYSLDGPMNGKAEAWKEGSVNAVLTRLVTGANACQKAKFPLKKAGG